MYVNTSYGQEGDIAKLSSRPLATDNSSHCLSLHYYGEDAVSQSMSVVLYLDSGGQQERYINNIDTQGRWFVDHIAIDSGLTQFHVIVAKGHRDFGVIAVDEITPLPATQCIGKYVLLEEDTTDVNR